MWVPYETVHINAATPLPPGSGCFAVTSNGLASGNHLLEAISHAIAEVVERDATTLWELRGDATKQRTRIDLDTVDDPACRTVLGKCEAAGVGVAAWDSTSDIGMASFVCAISERSPDPIRRLHPARGMGCHPNRGVALLRALTEAVQSRTTYISGSRDDLQRIHYERSASPDVLRARQDQIANETPIRHFHTIPSFDSDSFEADVAWQLERLRAVEVDHVVAVNLTRPEFDIPVVRVIIPKLEGPAERLTGYLPGLRARAVIATQGLR
jgi:ribosomal protein S12 methylthiotransferase accessory factor